MKSHLASFFVVRVRQGLCARHDCLSVARETYPIDLKFWALVENAKLGGKLKRAYLRVVIVCPSVCRLRS